MQFLASIYFFAPLVFSFFLFLFLFFRWDSNLMKATNPIKSIQANWENRHVFDLFLFFSFFLHEISKYHTHHIFAVCTIVACRLNNSAQQISSIALKLFLIDSGWKLAKFSLFISFLGWRIRFDFAFWSDWDPFNVGAFMQMNYIFHVYFEAANCAFDRTHNSANQWCQNHTYIKSKQTCENIP